MNEPLLTLLRPERNKLAGRELPAPFPVSNAFACDAVALHRWDECDSLTRDAPRFWPSPSGQGLTLTQCPTL